QQVAVVRAARLSRLARRAGRPALVPIGKIKNLAIRGAMHLLKFVVVPRIVGRVHVARPFDGTEVKRLGVIWSELFERMMEGDGVQPPPAPFRRIVAKQLLGASGRFLERLR